MVAGELAVVKGGRLALIGPAVSIDVQGRAHPRPLLLIQGRQVGEAVRAARDVGLEGLATAAAADGADRGGALAKDRPSRAEGKAKCSPHSHPSCLA